jgi:hypothetical protein
MMVSRIGAGETGNQRECVTQGLKKMILFAYHKSTVFKLDKLTTRQFI